MLWHIDKGNAIIERFLLKKKNSATASPTGPASLMILIRN